MTHDVADSLAGGSFPARAGFAARATGVEAQASDGHEHMAVAGINRDPFAFALFAVVKKFFRLDAAIDQPSFAEHVGRGTRAIVAGILELAVTATPFVWHLLKTIPGSDRTF